MSCAGLTTTFCIAIMVVPGGKTLASFSASTAAFFSFESKDWEPVHNADNGFRNFLIFVSETVVII